MCVKQIQNVFGMIQIQNVKLNIVNFSEPIPNAKQTPNALGMDLTVALTRQSNAMLREPLAHLLQSKLNQKYQLSMLSNSARLNV